MRKLLITAIVVLVIVAPLTFILFSSVLLNMPQQFAAGTTTFGAGSSLTGLSAYAQRTIPLAAQKLYTDPRVHAICPQLPAAVLAGIGTVETDNGLNDSTSSAGAVGFMQFEPSTFATYGVAIGHSGPPDINNPLDSVASAANLLCHNWDKNPAHLAATIEANYNHAWWYACDGVPGCPLNLDAPDNQPPGPGYRGVMAWAALYEPPVTVVTDYTSGGAPSAAASAALAFAVSKIGLPYIWGGTGPDGYDCSGLTSQAYLSAGVNIPRTSEAQWEWGLQHWLFIPPNSSDLLPGDLVFFNPGEQIAGEPGHVAMVVGRQGNTIVVVQAPQPGQNIGYITLGSINPDGSFNGPTGATFDYIGAFRPTVSH
jgi:cell wall-associated NlpC family hydrolase